MYRINKSITLLFLPALLWHANIYAEGVKMYTDRAPSAREMGSILFSRQERGNENIMPRTVKTRSISFGKAKMPEPTMAQAQAQAEVAGQEQSSIGLPIKFGYNSTRILPESVPFLNEVGKMLGMAEYAGEKLMIEGHTDASGAEDYNQSLSERRAQEVKAYLMNNYNIAGNRLFVSGRGENKPLPGVNPFAAVNRRVQFYRAQ